MDLLWSNYSGVLIKPTILTKQHVFRCLTVPHGIETEVMMKPELLPLLSDHTQLRGGGQVFVSDDQSHLNPLHLLHSLSILIRFHFHDCLSSLQLETLE